jgi:hypothetical protein
VPKSLAEIAIDAGLVKRDEVVQAARVADREGVPLVVALVRELKVDELALVTAVRRQVRVPLSDPATVELDPDALREVQRPMCRRLRVLPLSLSVYDTGPRLLRLAMADPTDAVAIAEIEHHTGCRVDVTLMPLSAVEEMVESGYRQFVTEVMKRREVSSRKVARGGKPAKAGAGGEQRAPAEGVQPTTMPYHRISEEAHISIRHQALLELLVEKHVVSEDQYEERVRQLMKGREDQG